MKSAENIAKGSVDAFKKEADKLIQNTTDDMSDYIDHTLNCFGEMDQIRIRATERFIQYETAYVRALIEKKIIPSELIRKVQELIFGKLPPHPEPTLFILSNPDEVWSREEPIWKEFDVNNEDPRRNRKPIILVHGAGYARKHEEANKFFKYFEEAAHLFKGDRPPNVDIYVLNYDSEITNETKTMINVAIETVLQEVVLGESDIIYTAALWKELVQRAHDAGERHLTPLFNKIFRFDVTEGYIVSHSLGNEAVAFAAKKYYEGRESDYIPICKSWWCMAAAIPADSFTNTGQYAISTKISLTGGNEEGTVVWFSRVDSVLSSLYPMGNITPQGEPILALGVTGALIHQLPLTNLDVTSCTLFTHQVTDGYFEKVGSNIRGRLGTEIWSEPMCEAKIPPRRD